MAAGETLATLAGPARSLLTAERILLNLIGRLSGIATLTRTYVDAVQRYEGPRSTTPARRRPAGGGWKSMPCTAAAATIIARACSTRS